MTFRMLYAAPYFALAIPVSARLHEAGTKAVPITAKGFDFDRGSTVSSTGSTQMRRYPPNEVGILDGYGSHRFRHGWIWVSLTFLRFYPSFDFQENNKNPALYPNI